MTNDQYAELNSIRNEVKAYVDSIGKGRPWLGPLQEKLRVELGYDDYRVETPVVYNRDLDAVGPDSAPAFILVADNPGKSEQKALNRRYLVGQSGKLAASWFTRELGMDFRASTLIINKTPLHTPKTTELKKLLILSGGRREELESLLRESQIAMASFAYRLHTLFGNVLWISGYGELGKRGLFYEWSKELRRLYSTAPARLWRNVWVFRHFSMNQFAIEYSRRETASDSPMDRLELIGTANRDRILGSSPVSE